MAETETRKIDTVIPESQVSDVKQTIQDLLPRSHAISTKSGATVFARTRYLEGGEALEEGLPVLVLIHGYPQS